MDITSAYRDIKEMNVLVAKMLELAIEDIKNQGINPLIVETYRSQERQNYLYCQGRTVDECIAKGIKKSFALKYCNPKANKITWTLTSIHKSKKAVDIVPQRIIDGKMTAIWNAKDKQTQIIIKTMEKYGFEAGANWKTTPDSPHYQVKGEFSNVFKEGHTTVYVTKVIQRELNRKINAGLTVDGSWGKKTTEAVNRFRKYMGYKNTTTGYIGKSAFEDLVK